MLKGVVLCFSFLFVKGKLGNSFLSGVTPVQKLGDFFLKVLNGAVKLCFVKVNGRKLFCNIAVLVCDGGLFGRNTLVFGKQPVFGYAAFFKKGRKFLNALFSAGNIVFKLRFLFFGFASCGFCVRNLYGKALFLAFRADSVFAYGAKLAFRGKNIGVKRRNIGVKAVILALGSSKLF